MKFSKWPLKKHTVHTGFGLCVSLGAVSCLFWANIFLFFVFRRITESIIKYVDARLVYRWKPCHSLLYKLIWVRLNRETKKKNTNRISTAFNHSTNREPANHRNQIRFSCRQLHEDKRRPKQLQKWQELYNIFVISELVRFFFGSQSTDPCCSDW